MTDEILTAIGTIAGVAVLVIGNRILTWKDGGIRVRKDTQTALETVVDAVRLSQEKLLQHFNHDTTVQNTMQMSQLSDINNSLKEVRDAMREARDYLRTLVENDEVHSKCETIIMTKQDTIASDVRELRQKK